MHELGCDSAINASADGTNDASFGPTDISYARDFLPDELFLEGWITQVFKTTCNLETQMKLTIVQFALHPQMLRIKREITSLPLGL